MLVVPRLWISRSISSVVPSDQLLAGRSIGLWLVVPATVRADHGEGQHTVWVQGLACFSCRVVLWQRAAPRPGGTKAGPTTAPLAASSTCNGEVILEAVISQRTCAQELYHEIISYL